MDRHCRANLVGKDIIAEDEQSQMQQQREGMELIHLVAQILRASFPVATECQDSLSSSQGSSSSYILVLNDHNATSSDFYCPMKILPTISLEHYLERLVVGMNNSYREKMGLESTGIRTLVMSLIYLDRLMKLTDFMPDPLNVHRIIFIGMHVAMKILQDVHNSTKVMSRIGGVPISELNNLELKFCSHLKFRFEVSNEMLLLTISAILKTANHATSPPFEINHPSSNEMKTIASSYAAVVGPTGTTKMDRPKMDKHFGAAAA